MTLVVCSLAGLTAGLTLVLIENPQYRNVATPVIGGIVGLITGALWLLIRRLLPAPGDR